MKICLRKHAGFYSMAKGCIVIFLTILCNIHLDEAFGDTGISAKLTWTKNVNEHFEYYQLHRSTNPDFVPSDTTVVPNFIDSEGTPERKEKFHVAVDNTSHTDENLDPNVTYYYKLRLRANGKNVDSNLASVTTTNDSAITLKYSGRLRACAGTVLNDVHIVTVNIRLVQTKNKVATAFVSPLKVVLEDGDNPGTDTPGEDHPQRAKIIVLDGQGKPVVPTQLVKTWDCTPVADTNTKTGNIAIKILSGQVVGNAKVSIKFLKDPANPNSLTTLRKIPLEFASAECHRGFGIQEFYREDFPEDDGWEIFTPNSEPLQHAVLIKPGQVVGAKVYLKFREDPRLPEASYFRKQTTAITVGSPNRSYSLVAKSPTELLSKNWSPAAHHVLRVSAETSVRRTYSPDHGLVVGDLIRQPLSGSGPYKERLRHQVLFTNAQGELLATNADGTPKLDASGNQQYIEINPASGLPVDKSFDFRKYVYPKYITVTTDFNGTATIFLKAGPLLFELNEVSLGVEDRTQWAK